MALVFILSLPILPQKQWNCQTNVSSKNSFSFTMEMAETIVSVHSSHHTPPGRCSGGFLLYHLIPFVNLFAVIVNLM
ncbi:MAG: hypothetical protein DCF12_06790 [Snowella sp.]|nr:MAG: hypothetical protein DCF12_06790 [Snowella sp.]